MSDGLYREHVPQAAAHHLWALVHQCEGIQKIFSSFKETVDEKYWEVWKQHHPGIKEKYEREPSF